MPVMIPEDYVADLPVRLALYRRLAEIEDERDIEAFGAHVESAFAVAVRRIRQRAWLVALVMSLRFGRAQPTGSPLHV